jgi:hypothetical protein
MSVHIKQTVYYHIAEDPHCDENLSGNRRGVYRVFVGNLRDGDLLEDLVTDWRIIFE